MTRPDDVQHRTYHQPDPDRIDLREDGDGVFRVRMPIATTGEVRNQGDDPLTREELEGMGAQIESRRPSVFLDHGKNPDVAGSRYSATEVSGTWEDPEVQSREVDDEDELVADARLMDPATLPAETGMLREALARVKEQVERDIPLRSSIGWADDDSAPGNVDFMEASLVGIPADPRTSSEGAALAQARAVVMEPEEHRHLSAQQAEMAQQVLAAYRDEQGNGTVKNFESWLWSTTQFDEAMVHAATTALEKFYRANTPLEEPVTDSFDPFLDDRQSGDADPDSDDDTQNMSDTDPGDGGDSQDPDGTQDGQDGISADEFREQMLEQQNTQTEILRTLAENREDDGDDDDDEDEEDDEDTQSADTRTITVDGEDLEPEAAQQRIKEMREDLADADPAEPDDGRDADDVDEEDDDQPADSRNLLTGGNA